MYTCPIRNRFAYCGVAKLSTAVVAFGAVALVTMGAPLVFSFGLFFSKLKVNATSLALNALPSFHFTPERVVSVSVLPPFDQAAFVASIGIGACAELSVLKMNSGSLYSDTAFVR